MQTVDTCRAWQRVPRAVDAGCCNALARPSFARARHPATSPISLQGAQGARLKAVSALSALGWEFLVSHGLPLPNLATCAFASWTKYSCRRIGKNWSARTDRSVTHWTPKTRSGCNRPVLLWRTPSPGNMRSLPKLVARRPFGPDSSASSAVSVGELRFR
jgi:hypothetical protein